MAAAQPRHRKLTRGEENCDWIETHCRVPEGTLVGQAVRLRAFQRKIILGIYDGLLSGRRLRRALISFGRKNGKTALAAFIVLLHLVGPEARENSQIYSAAQSRDQASILFALAAKVVRMSPDLMAYVKVTESQKTLTCPELGTMYRALSADASTAYGLSPVLVIHDELGQVRGPRSELYDALETASAAQEDPLSIVISTQAPTDADLLSVLIDDAKAKGDPRTGLFLYTAPEDADPWSDAAIIAANPAFGDFQNADEVRDQAQTAKRMPSREASYRNLILNQRVNMVNPFISRGVWEKNGGEVEDEPFLGDVIMGIDLSQRNDLTAVVEGADDEAGNVHLRAKFFAPEIGLADRAHRDRSPYDVWARDGWIEATPGASVDYELVADYIIDRRATCRKLTVVADRWRLDELKGALSRRGADIEIEPFGQGFVSMAPALDAFEGLLLNGKIRHGNNPVMRMCAANAVAVRDPAGNRKLDKSKATGRIDGMIGATMVIGHRAKTQQVTPPEYQILVY